MKIVLQRCAASRVEVDGEIVGQISRGLTLFVGIERGDDEAELQKMARKIVALRIFDDDGRFRFSVRDVGGEILAIPNFTLCAQTHKGTRPDFGAAARPEVAQTLFERFVTLLKTENVRVASGIFGAQMAVFVENDGPVTLVLETATQPQTA